RADRNAASQRFRKGHNIRNDPCSEVASGKEPISGSPDSRLYLVKDQNGANLIAECSQLRKELRRSFTNPRHRLDRFDDDACRLFIDHLPDTLDRIEISLDVKRNIRFAELAVLSQERRRDRVRRPSVETSAECSELLPSGRHSSHSHRILVGLGARVAEKSLC